MSTALFAFKYKVQKILNPTDENTLNLLSDYTMANGRNYEILIKIEKDNITAKTLEQLRTTDCVLSDRLCYCMTYPWITYDHLKPSVFHQYEAPSFYHRYKRKNDKIIIEELKQHTIPMEEYIVLANNKIEQNIKSFLDKSKKIILLYSRGIDSLLLLSYIIKYNRLKDTRLIHIGDSTNKQSYIDTTLEKKLGIDVELMFFDYDFLYKNINVEDPFYCKEILSHWFVEKFKDSAILNGDEGNSVLFHKWEWVKRIGKPVTKKNLYTFECENIDWNTPTDLNYHTISLIYPKSRFWNNDGFKNIYSPISDLELLKILPFVDIRNLDPNFVGDAVMVRNMIKANVGDTLNHLISSTTLSWGAPLYQDTVDMKKININGYSLTIDSYENKDILKIKQKFKHPAGIANLLKRIEQAKSVGEILYKDVLVLKFLNYLL